MRGKGWAGKPAESGRPLWGFCRIKVEMLCRLWAGYREGALKRTDIQTWFAVHELLMRRCTLAKRRRPAYSHAELLPLTGLSAPQVRASISRLEGAGLLGWSEHQVTILDGTTGTPSAANGVQKMLASVVNHRRTVPVPRHTVLFLARTRRPVILATLLGHLLRCVYYRSGECVSWGTCKASWIAGTFGVDARNVKAARQELQQLGWMRQLESQHWHRQRYGSIYVLSLAWDSRQHAPLSKRVVTVSPPRRTSKAVKSPPPESHWNLPTGLKYQKRHGAEPTGVRIQNPKPEGSPRFAHVVPEDLVDPFRTAELFRQAAEARLVRESPMDRLQFFAAAARAMRLGSRNPAGFFVRLVRQRLWLHINHADEHSARSALARMPEFFYGDSPAVPSSHRTPFRQPPDASPHHRSPTNPVTLQRLVQNVLSSMGCP